MKKKTNVRQVIRKIVREEVAMAIHEVITELKQPTQQVSQPKPKKKIVEKQTFTKNSILNDVLNETAMDEEWNTLGDGKYDSSKMNEIMSREYSGLGGGNVNIPQNAEARIREMGAQPEAVPEKVVDNIFNKDYGALMKAIDKKQGK